MQTIGETLASISAAASADKPVVANLANFPQLESLAKAAPAGSLNHLLDVSVCVTAELGRANMSIGDVMKIGLGSVVGLNRGVTEPVELLVQGVPFARGEVVVVDDRFAIRIREIVDPAQQNKK
jgi:flagellar motor switch protein FliN/FliY